ncbi:Alpha/beta hydrolase fold-3 [Dillenia turbinata]|uniref:Alpha/beta hydrolase fold-3 n=1 Tax=Dillenia turbinata TaxID=194707 RepID=A0AAN8W6H0_9MAGN
MDSHSATNDQEIIQDFQPLFRVYKDGKIERFMPFTTVPPSTDPETGVQSKDITIDPKTAAAVRVFLPKSGTTDSGSSPKLPLLVYFHGGAFSIQSAFSTAYHKYVGNLAGEAKAIAVSVDYRLAPENPIPACYDDCWAAIQWVFSHAGGTGPDPWLNEFVDFRRVILAGDSAGANLAHSMVVKLGSGHVAGLAVIHPFFGNGEPDKLWDYLCSEPTGANDPRLNPMAHPDMLASLGCRKVLVCIAEKDFLLARGKSYIEALKKNGWTGELEVEMTEGEGHCFHLFDSGCEKAGLLMKRVAQFLNSV